VLTIADSVRAVAECDPTRSAIIAGRQTVSYGQLHATSELIRETLRRAQPRGHRIALLLGNNWKHIAALLAADAEGLTAVPLDVKWSRTQVEQRLELTSTTTLLVEGPAGPVIESLREIGSNSALGADEPFVINGDLVSTLAPTGGTSGTAKAVALSRRAVLSRFIAQAVEFGFARDTTFLCASPLFHGGGRSFALSQLYFGGSVLLQSSFNPDVYADSLRHSDIAFAVPTMLHRLPRDTKAPNLRCLIVSGAKLDEETAAIAASISETAVDYYASVDTGPIGVRHILSGDPSRVAFSASIVNRPTGATSETPLVVDFVDIRGTCVADAELKNGQIRVFSVDVSGHPTARMHDRVEFTSPCGLRPLGRSDDLIVTGGVNVDPAAVEEALRQELAPGLQIAVLGVPDAEWGQRVVAFTAGEATVDRNQILQSVRKRLSGPETPKELFSIRDFPLTNVGKLDKKALLSIYAEYEEGKRERN